MTNLLWILFCALFALFLELFCAYNYLALPIIATVCLYVTVVFGWRKTALIFLVVGVIFDAVLARWIPFTPLLVLSAAGLGELCSYIGLTRSQVVSAGSGFVLCACMLVWVGLTEILFPELFTASSWLHAIWSKGLFVFSPLVLTPFCMSLLDSLAFRVGASTLEENG